MKTTTTLMEIIQSELINMGKNEFYNENQLTFFDEEYSFINKIMVYDDDVHKIVTNMFFRTLKLSNHESDKKFKKTFMNKFLDRQISFQTVETFSSKVVYTFMINYDFLNIIYDDLDKYIQDERISTTDNKGNNKSDMRNANSTLPQNQVNVDVDSTILKYADDFTMNRNKQENESQSVNRSSGYNLENLLKTNKLLENIFTDFDRNCFLQVW